MENNNFAPMPTPPPEIAKALGWRTTEDTEESEEKAALDLLNRTTSISNPWLTKAGVNGVIEFGDDDAREAREYAASIEPVAKLFTPKETGNNVPSFNRPLPVEQDEDEKIYFAALKPIQKLFFPDVITVAPSTLANLHKDADEWDTPLKKTTQRLTYKKRPDENGLLWSEGYSADGELQSYMLVLDETDD